MTSTLWKESVGAIGCIRLNKRGAVVNGIENVLNSLLLGAIRITALSEPIGAQQCVRIGHELSHVVSAIHNYDWIVNPVINLNLGRGSLTEGNIVNVYALWVRIPRLRVILV